MTRDIPLDQIERNPDQPRKTFPAEHIERLARSIKKRGLIQPITVRPVGDRFQIVAGECRFRAHQSLKAPTIRCEIVEIDTSEMQLRAIVENLQRQDMNPIEEGRAYKALLDAGYSLPLIVEELGLTGTAIVQNRIDLLELETDIQQLVAAGTLPVSMGWAVRLAPRALQMKIVRDITSGRLRTVEQVRHACIALREASAQIDAFAMLPAPSMKDLAALSRLEKKIDAVASMVQSGFKEGACVAAQRVAPDRVKRMADLLALIRKHCLDMEHALRCAATQSEIKLEYEEQNRADNSHPNAQRETQLGVPDRERRKGHRKQIVANKLPRPASNPRQPQGVEKRPRAVAHRASEPKVRRSGRRRSRG